MIVFDSKQLMIVRTTFSGLRLRRETFGRAFSRTVVGGARVVSGAAKKAFDRGGPIWPPRSNAADDRLGGVWGCFAPPAKNGGVWGAAPPSQNRFFVFGENQKNRKVVK